MGLGAKILAGLAMVLGIMWTAMKFLAGVKKAGQDQIRAETSGKAIADATEAKRVQNEVAGASDDAVDSWLRAPGQRDKR